MWLLNVHDYRLIDIVNPENTRYAILSHTWGTGEVSFNDIQCLEAARQKPAWHKIQATCRIAREQGLSFVWIDTCCIDKSSSAELSEAINSMFRWYLEAETCVAYLEDVDDAVPGASMEKSRWFTRGWTLQELIAPKKLSFYDCNWNRLGCKTSMTKLLSDITNIDEQTLVDPDRLSMIPVARRMSWAAKRQTTRPEDLAYCMLGIFGVNMPLIYGEGANAFLRLQEAIALATEDLSLFAWAGPDSTSKTARYRGVLAREPSQFAHCHELENIDDPLEMDSRTFELVNHCFRFQTCLMTDSNNGEYLMRLHCRMAVSSGQDVVVIRLLKTPGGFVRHRSEEVSFMDQHHNITDPAAWDPIPRTLTIPKTLRNADLLSIRRRFHDAFHFKVSTDQDWYYKLAAALPDLADEAPTATHWDSSTGRYMTNSYPLFTGLLTVTVYDSRGAFMTQFLVCFGFAGYRKRGADIAPKPWVALSRAEADAPIQTSWADPGLFGVQDAVVEDKVFDLAADVLAEQHRMHYLRFTSYAGRFFRKALETDGTMAARLVQDKLRSAKEEMGGKKTPIEYRTTKPVSPQRHASGRHLRTSLLAPGFAFEAELQTLDAGNYTTHRVSISLGLNPESKPAPPPIRLKGSKVMNGGRYVKSTVSTTSQKGRKSKATEPLSPSDTALADIRKRRGSFRPNISEPRWPRVPTRDRFYLPDNLTSWNPSDSKALRYDNAVDPGRRRGNDDDQSRRNPFSARHSKDKLRGSLRADVETTFMTLGGSSPSKAKTRPTAAMPTFPPARPTPPPSTRAAPPTPPPRHAKPNRVRHEPEQPPPPSLGSVAQLSPAESLISDERLEDGLASVNFWRGLRAQ